MRDVRRMKRMFPAAWVAVLLVVLALVAPSNEARANEDLDVAKVLARPGVRLVAVEFYASWCEPCMKAMPRWKALKEKYAKQGLRVVVVNTLDPNAGCRSLGWVPDETVCDLEGEVSERFQLKGQLPAAFLWSWQGNLLVKAGHVDEVERAIEKYLGEAPRVILEVGEGVPPAVVAAVREALIDGGKVHVLAGDEERRAIDAAKRKSQESRFDERYACEIGKELPPNSLLKISRVAQGKSAYLNVGLYDLVGGCQAAQASTSWDADARSMAREAVGKLVQKIERPGGMQMPTPAKAGSVPAPGKREDKIQNAADSKWRPTSNDPVLVTLESQPAGARVEMDGATLCAATPCKKMVDPGLRTFRMSADKHVTKEERVRVDGDEQRVVWKLEGNTAVVTVDTGAVSGVPIVIDGEAAGKSPLRVELAAGPHRIEIKDACYELARADVGVERGAPKRVELNGVQKTAGLRVELSDSKDEPVQGDVKLDGVVVGRTWKTLTVPACGKELEVTAKEGGMKQSVSLRAQKTTTVAVRVSPGLDPNRAPSTVAGMAIIPGKPGKSGFLGIGSQSEIARFLLDVTEVTVEAYAACVQAGACSEPDRGENCNFGRPERANHPVNCVDWNQANAFCAWARKRLPTDDEWQHAAESAEGRTYPWGEEVPSHHLCWKGTSRSVGTCPVGSFPSGDSAQGVKDLSGNVWEWTESCFDRRCSSSVLRGGSWTSLLPRYVRAASRDGADATWRTDVAGFRCARSN
jgi:thiol-disulfide isomerase/thioredoxin